MKDYKGTYHITTFGCQMNEHDSENIAGMLREAGWTESEIRNDADLIIMNTCSIRENADKRFFGTLGQLKKVKEKRDVIVAVCGCMMQQQHVTETLKAKYPWVDIVFGTHNIHEFSELLERRLEGEKKLVSVLEDRTEIVEPLPAQRKFKHKSFVNIVYGCNNFCTYCIVPYTRGREKSRRPEDILNEIRGLAADGVKEVMLLGQNVNSYGASGADFGVTFPDLLRQVNEVEGIERIRFMTSHPKDLSDDLISAIAECEHVCPHVHLPVQSGSSRILKAMNRKYDRQKYLELVDKLRAAVPDIALTTDIIVGFPGETEEDFLETLSLVEKVRYDSAFTFLYSVRKGTPAEIMPNKIPENVKHERFDRLVEAVNRISEEKNKLFDGRTEPVLIEGLSKESRHGKNCYQGRTPGFKLVNIPSEKDHTGEIVKVKITSSNTFSLEGEIVE